MGQVHVRDISLKDLAGRADLIVVARPLKPFTSTRTVPVKAGRKKAPSFTTTVYHAEVVETLYYAFDGPVPKRLDAESADWETELRLHRKYYVDGESQHVVREFYRSSLQAADQEKGPMILFLFYRSNTAEFVVQGAHESLAKKAEVLRLIEQRKRSDGR